MRSANLAVFHMHYNKGMKPYVLDETEHEILIACTYFNGMETTNSAIKAKAKAKARVRIPAADVGLIMSRLRVVELITYAHIETGRKAAGSGRYVMKTFNDYFGSVFENEEERLP